MKKILKISIFALLIIIFIIVGAVIFIVNTKPSIPYDENLTIEITPERIARGDYLANHVTVCMDCHSTRDWSLFSGPLAHGTLGKGGELFDQTMGLPGKYISPNITPYGIKDMSDGEVYRAITAGVGRDNRPLFPIMPYYAYGRLADEEIFSIIAYIRTIEPIEATQPVSKSDFPVNVLVHTMPKPGTPMEVPPKENFVKYGEYMTTAAGCIECHTPFEKGKLVMDMSFAGGREFPLPNGIIVRTPNITPDSNTGIGEWDEEIFVDRFKAYDLESFDPPKIGDGQFQSIMPWTMYAGMEEEDIKAIFAYLQTLEPIENKVVLISQQSN